MSESRYTKEYEAYKQTEAYKQFTQLQNEKKLKDNKEKHVKTIVSNVCILFRYI